MLGMMQGKGGEQSPQGQPSMSGGLASLFANNAAAVPSQMPTGMPGGMQPPAALPQIAQPQRPNIPPPMARPIPPAPSILPPVAPKQEPPRVLPGHRR